MGCKMSNDLNQENKDTKVHNSKKNEYFLVYQELSIYLESMLLTILMMFLN
jgi:hypothetical protein